MSSTPPPLPPPLPQQPIPVTPLAYTTPTATGRRPGILTAVAVLSITLGSIGILWGGATALFATFMTFALSQAPGGTTPATVVTPPPAATTAETDPAVDEDAFQDGTPAADRRRLADGMARLRPLSDTRRRHLDALLAEAGRKILPITGDALTPAVVAANVTDAGQYPSGTGKPSAGADYFVLARGRVEVTDHHAVFHPAGGGQSVRAAATSDDPSVTDEADPFSPSSSATTLPAGHALTDGQIQQVVTAIESKIGGKIPAAQIQTLRAQLALPSQSLFTRPGDPGAVPLRAQVNTAQLTNGTLVFTTPTGYMSIDSTGTVTGTASFNFTATTAPTPVAAAFANSVKPQLILTLLSVILSAILAVFLLVCGIYVTRNSPHGRRLHLIYAYSKIALSLASMAVATWLFYNLMTTGGAATGIRPTWGLSFAFALPSVVSMIYPLALIIIFHTRTVREYYAADPAAH